MVVMTDSTFNASIIKMVGILLNTKVSEIAI